MYRTSVGDSDAGQYTSSFSVLLEAIPTPAFDVAKSREFVDIGLQLAEESGGPEPLVVWCILAGHLTRLQPAMRIFSQMNSKAPGDMAFPGAAKLLMAKVLLPLCARFKKDIYRPALQLAADFCENVHDIEERQTLTEHIVTLLSHISPSAKRRRFSPELFIDLAAGLLADDRMREAEAAARIGLAYFPHVPELLAYRTERYFGDNFFDRHPSELERLIALFPDQPEFRKKQAFYLLEREDYGRAIDDLRAYLDLVPEDYEVRSAYAQALAMNYKPIEALEEFTALIELDPLEAKNYLGRGRVYDQLDMTERAIEDYTRTLELDPSLIEASIGREQSMMKRQALGMDDEVYSAFLSGGEDKFIGDIKVPSEKFDDIAGLDAVKETIRETIQYPLTHPELSEKYGKRAGGGVLFFGPPGCGKTMLARAAAGECGISLFNVNLSSVLDKWVGNSEKAIAMIFRSARKKTPCMIFFDELDSLGMAREDTHTGWEKKIISQLLTEMDGLSSDNRNVMILGATNAPWNVDHALRRAGRFGKSVYVPPPDVIERKAIFKLYLDRRPFVDSDGIDYETLAEKTHFHSSDSIRQIVEDAATIPWKQAIRTGEERPIEMADVLKAVESRQPDLVEWDKLVSRYEEFARAMREKPVIGFRSTKAKPQSV
jgi:ATP-dependent 26S proteasome regulatory subunit